jgi:hypothetical protein
VTAVANFGKAFAEALIDIGPAGPTAEMAEIFT